MLSMKCFFIKRVKAPTPNRIKHCQRVGERKEYPKMKKHAGTNGVYREVTTTTTAQGCNDKLLINVGKVRLVTEWVVLLMDGRNREDYCVLWTIIKH